MRLTPLRESTQYFRRGSGAAVMQSLPGDPSPRSLLGCVCGSGYPCVILGTVPLVRDLRVVIGIVL